MAESFETVLHMLRTEEPEPSHEALLRWAERYPQYRDDLVDYFASWATEDLDDDSEPEEDFDHDWLTDFGVTYGRQILRRQKQGIPDKTIQPLNAFEQLVPTAITVLGTPRWRYVENIAAKVAELSGREVSQASILETLNSLEGRYAVCAYLPDITKYPRPAGSISS